MLTKNDCMSILVRLGDDGVKDVNRHIRLLTISKEIPLETLKFISDNRGIEVANFYEMLRKKHNQKKSPLYTNIVREIDDVDNLITTLSCLLVQVNLYGAKLENKEEFLREVRAEEISRVLNTYYKDGTSDACASLLKLIKADVLCLEYIAGRRDLAK